MRWDPAYGLVLLLSEDPLREPIAFYPYLDPAAKGLVRECWEQVEIPRAGECLRAGPGAGGSAGVPTPGGLRLDDHFSVPLGRALSHTLSDRLLAELVSRLTRDAAFDAAERDCTVELEGAEPARVMGSADLLRSLVQSGWGSLYWPLSDMHVNNVA